MANTLLAILFATSSANDQTIAFRYPPSPHAFPRLARPRPPIELDFDHVDAPYRAATFSDDPGDDYHPIPFSNLEGDQSEYEWQRPTIRRYRSQSFASSARSSSGDQHSPVNQRGDHRGFHANEEVNHYETALGFNVDLLANFLCPNDNNCHQKFELIVDDLAFIGHPVCVDERGKWSFSWEPTGEHASKDTAAIEGSSDETYPKTSATAASKGMLRVFHVVFVLDLPDPSSSASGNLNKYFDVIYQSVAFPLTAVLFNEQVLHGYVEKEWDLLVKLKEDGVSHGELFEDNIQKCLEKSSLAFAMEHVYTSIRSNSLARVTLNNISLDLQLPPYLDSLLRADGSSDLGGSENGYEDENDDAADWGPELSFGWRLPSLTPWKSLLLLDVNSKENSGKADPLQNLNRPGFTKEEREIAEGISRFLDNASVFVSLYDMAILLDWDLHKQVFPTVRYLVQRRRAKVVDLVRSSLKSIFTLCPHKGTPTMSELTAEFSEAFPNLPILPVILSRLSSSPDNFFETVVRSKELIPVYQNVVVWLLKRDLIAMLHMRFRLVASSELKQVVAAARLEKRSTRNRLAKAKEEQKSNGRRRKSSTDSFNVSPSVSRSRSLLRSAVLPDHNEEALEDESEDDSMLSPISQTSAQGNWDLGTPHSFRSPPALERGYEPWGPASLLASEHQKRRRRFSDTSSSAHTRLRTRSPWSRGHLKNEGDEEEAEAEESDSESDPEDPDYLETATLIANPERATPRERRWLRGMAMGKNPVVTKRFEEIHKYFDGKHTVDEILHKADISRKQLREVLHHFADHITSFLHP